ncbi:TatD family hydrolase [Sulfurovum sp. zt1-1]|uniref:TatD family hydrolase n=1 Tax=Sulfurovum zhangzhouensis TaxID=3019067 RepID=A0ABT7QVQ6_9BACT|nr:TatD family hydrolase [Sulfurovum zhangzhouensis]MDM5270624.1 TatD family hydrolase [Sulfurovum zhangzhouensis]
MIIDTHCHLDDERYNKDLDIVLANAKSKGVEKFIIPGADPKSLPRAVEIAEKYDDVYFAVGVHPYDAAEYDRAVLEPYVHHPKCVAIGECGLDYYRLPESEEEIVAEKKLQKEVFIDQIEWAKELDKPLIVHIREANADSLELLEKYAGDRGGVLHCYNADEQLLKLAKNNFYYGIGGVLTFKNARKLINVYPKIPTDRLLIETDAPYLTPHPHRGERNEPSYTTLVADKMSELSGISRKEIEKLTTDNSLRLFSL